MLVVWSEPAWEDYLRWQAQDRDTHRPVSHLIRDFERRGNEGIGKPEPLRHDVAGHWSRRITDQHRLVCTLAGDEIRIAACRYLYG